jgi:hypothetical protein
MNTWTPILTQDKEVLGYLKDGSKPKEGPWARAKRLAKEHHHCRKVSVLEVAITFFR